jgi:hypothetical protein
LSRMGGRAVEGTGLENRQTRKGLVGSNPTPSARQRDGLSRADRKVEDRQLEADNRMYLVRRTAPFCVALSFVCFFVGVGATPRLLAAESNSDTMKFELRPPNRLVAAITGDSAWTIYAVGTIDEQAPARLQDLIKKNAIPSHSTVDLSSLGGNLIAGMKLGQIFRRSEFDTEIARADPADKVSSLPGQCFSACSLAFLGGRWRYIKDGSAYGVHRFYFTKSTAREGDIAQMMSAVVIQYIRDMGADPDLFTEMTAAGRDNIILIPRAELLRLNVVNNGQSPTVWSVESVSGVVYLKGQRNTAFGTNKFILACTKQGTDLTIVLDPVANGPLPPTGAVTLVAGDKEYPIENAMNGAPTLHNGSVFVSFILRPDIVRAVEAAHEVGVTFQVDRGAPTYVGFRGMPVDDGAKKMPGVVQGCV